MAYNNGAEKFDEVAHLKSKNITQLFALRTQFELAMINHPQHSFASYLGLINVEIASRIGKKSK